jgi:hypothetical protein
VIREEKKSDNKKICLLEEVVLVGAIFMITSKKAKSQILCLALVW